MIPSCALWAIRDAFPAVDGNYVPFMESRIEEQRLLCADESEED